MVDTIETEERNTYIHTYHTHMYTHAHTHTKLSSLFIYVSVHSRPKH